MSKVVVISMLLALSGCAHQMAQESATSHGLKHEFDQNYKIGERRKANVGDSIIRVKDYYLERISVPAVIPTETVTINGPVVPPMVFSSAQSYRVRGRVEIDGVTYLVVPGTDNPIQWQAAMVRLDGTIHNRRLNYNPGLAGPVMMVYEQSITPSTAKMLRKTEEKISTTKGYQNYEIIYNGVSSGAIQFTYREYSPEGLARTAFYQNLTYDSKADSIRFKKFRIGIHSANSESVEYTVLEDGR
jgi:hypothetical protein